tara:strand:- start:1204 stop:1983 length:780 start_codon:yes stop_codon:yes gene_type:complete
MSYLSKLFNLKNTVSIITGASGYLCSEMAMALHKSGSSVVILDKNKSKANLVCSDIINNGGKSIAIEIDVTKKSDFINACDLVLDQFGKIDILINGAGINAPTKFFEIKEEEWDSILATHLKGTLFSCQVFGRHMISQQKGSVINISSASAGPPLSKAFAYSVAKSGIKNLTQNLAREWAVHGVRVNALRPGFFPTEWSKKNFITKKRENAILNHTPMGRYGHPKELVGAVLWLSSENASSFVTGAEIAVDGGFSSMTI